MQRRTFVTLLAASPLAACIGPAQRQASLRGTTMGTSYSVKFTPADATPLPQIKTEIDQLLLAVNRSMSTYDPNSELSRLNRYRAGLDFAVSPALHQVVFDAVRVSELSQGAFDVTVGPLVDAWGFGPQLRKFPSAPPAGLIDDTLQQVGYRQLRLRSASSAIVKAHPDLAIDLSGIAKGYGVDQVALLLEAKGVNDYLVEIGGELRAKGVNRDARPWRIAIEEPLPGQRSVRKIVGLRPPPGATQALATSGNYRNFFDYQGRRYSHMIDPTSGWPVDHRLASVSVIAPSAVQADAWATALQVLGPERGARLAEQQGLAALFVNAGDGGLAEHASSAFQPFLEST